MPDDVPLLLVGDVHGCCRAMRELASRARQENLAKRRGALPGTERKIVFVGDMADRGPFDAESVIYIIALVRSGRALLVKGNHDENLLEGLKGQEVRSAETRRTLMEIKKRLKPASIQKIIEVLEAAPRYAEWKGIAAVHGSLPRLPRTGEAFSQREQHELTFGARSGRFVGGRAEVHKLRHTVATDPGIFVVGGHTHERMPMIDALTNTAMIDAGVELSGSLSALYYPERELVTAKEPSVVRLYGMLCSPNLPTGEDLPLFVEYARQQGFVEVKEGQNEFEGLKIVSYSGMTEMTNAWATYPLLRNFRGLIINERGEVIARPFHKTHKAGVEIPFETLDVVPEKVFEKANGSLGIVYFWQGQWRCATKFSFQNEGYTKPAERMLAAMKTDGLDPARTYLFEIILPNDQHIVDYGGREEFVLLNSVQTDTGEESSWEDVERIAKDLGARTAEDMTGRFASMTVAEIYRRAQTPDVFPNLEGLMARVRDDNGNTSLIKIKCRGYDEKKFVRDHLDWETLFDALDPKTLTCPPETMEELLKYNIDNVFAKGALMARLQWIHEEYQAIAERVRAFLFAPYAEAEQAYMSVIESGEKPDRALNAAMKASVPVLIKLLDQNEHRGMKEEKNVLMGFLRGLLSKKGQPEEAIASFALKKMRGKIEEMQRKKGKNAYWLVPR